MLFIKILDLNIRRDVPNNSLVCLAGFLLPTLLYANLHSDDRCEIWVHADGSKKDKYQVDLTHVALNSLRSVDTYKIRWIGLTFLGYSLAPVWRQAITWTNADSFSIGHLWILKLDQYTIDFLLRKWISNAVWNMVAILSRYRHINYFMSLVDPADLFCIRFHCVLYFCH